MIKMKKKVKLFQDPVRLPIRTSIFFSHYCQNFIEVQLNICSFYNEYNFDARVKKAIPRIIEIKN